MITKNELLAAATVSDPRWSAVVARNREADGKFFYSVETTGVYSRPSCAARPPRPENVAFHLTAADAERAGFRPCKRCKPDQSPLADREVAEPCRFIENAEQPRTEIRFAVGECSLGSILVAQSDRGVCAILMGDDPGQLARDLQDRFPQANLIGGDADFEQLVAKVVRFVQAYRWGVERKRALLEREAKQ